MDNGDKFPFVFFFLFQASSSDNDEGEESSEEGSEGDDGDGSESTQSIDSILNAGWHEEAWRPCKSTVMPLRGCHFF